MHALLRDLLPHFRHLGGEGNRQTLTRLGELIPLTTHEVPSGTQAFDWTVPNQWTFRDGYVNDATGRRVIDAHASNLHVISHSRPVHQTMELDQLRPHLHTRPDQPTRVPYRHTFYEEIWGFCLSHNQLRQIERENAGPYEVCLDAELKPGPATLVYGQCVLPGDEAQEVLCSAHSCHPSMANDNLSAMVIQAYLAHLMAQHRNRLTYRFLFAPATIGALAWLSRNHEKLDRILGGLVLENLGDPAPLTYQRTRAGETPIDHAATSVLRQDQLTHFNPTGGDERQFGSPRLNLPIGALMRSRPGEYREYHTSADNADLVTPYQLSESLTTCMKLCEAMEDQSTSRRSPTNLGGHGRANSAVLAPADRSEAGNQYLINRLGYGEPQLGRRGVLAAIQAEHAPKLLHQAVLWTLNLADGDHALTDIAARSDLPRPQIDRAAALLLEFGLLATLEQERANQ